MCGRGWKLSVLGPKFPSGCFYLTNKGSVHFFCSAGAQWVWTETQSFCNDSGDSRPSVSYIPAFKRKYDLNFLPRITPHCCVSGVDEIGHAVFVIILQMLCLCPLICLLVERPIITVIGCTFTLISAYEQALKTGSDVLFPYLGINQYSENSTAFSKNFTVFVAIVSRRVKISASLTAAKGSIVVPECLIES